MPSPRATSAWPPHRRRSRVRSAALWAPPSSCPSCSPQCPTESRPPSAQSPRPPGSRQRSGIRKPSPAALRPTPHSSTVCQQAKAGGAGVNPLNDSSFIQQLDPRLARPFLIGFSQAMDLVFLIGAAVMVIAFVVVWFLPHVELRSGSSYESRGKQDAADAATIAEEDDALPSFSH